MGELMLGITIFLVIAAINTNLGKWYIIGFWNGNFLWRCVVGKLWCGVLRWLLQGWGWRHQAPPQLKMNSPLRWLLIRRPSRF